MAGIGGFVAHQDAGQSSIASERAITKIGAGPLRPNPLVHAARARRATERSSAGRGIAQTIGQRLQRNAVHPAAPGKPADSAARAASTRRSAWRAPAARLLVAGSSCRRGGVAARHRAGQFSGRFGDPLDDQ